MNVLFTSAGRRVELLRAFKDALRELAIDGRVVALDIDPLAPALQVGDGAHLVPRLDDPHYIPTLVDICRKETIDLVFPLIDPDVPVLAAHRKEIEVTGARVVVVPEDSAAVTADKLLTHEFFARIGVPTPKTYGPGDLDAAALEFPLFIKPRFGSAGKDAYVVRNRRELEFLLDYVPHPVVQELLPGPEITNDVLCDFNGTVRAVVSRERIEVRWGEVQKGRTIYDARIIEDCMRIARGLDAIGPITVQCIMRDGHRWFTEVNARFGGGAPLGLAAGVASPKWLLAMAAGRAIEIPPIGSYQTGLYLSRFDESFVLREEDRADFESRRF